MSSPEADKELKDPGRAELIAEFARCLYLREFNLSSWLFLWFSDLETLHHIVQVTSSPVFLSAARDIFGPEGKTMDKFLKSWLTGFAISNNYMSTGSPAETDNITNLERDESLLSLCMERDRGQCVLTKCSDLVEVCHIYPILLGRKAETEEHSFFWSRLGLFYSQEQVKTWQDLVESQEHRAEFLGNSICLTSYVRELWESGLCAFKPIERTNGEGDEEYLTLEFYYLPSPIQSESIRVKVGTRPLLPSNLTRSPGGLAVANYEKGIFLVSGDRFTLRTHNKNTHPLPSWDLLMMQWDIQRIASLRGVAELFNDDGEEEEDDDDDDDYDSESSFE